MNDFYDLLYYITLFVSPLALYALIFKNNYSKNGHIKDWFYFIKKRIAKSAVKKFQAEREWTLDQILEQPTAITTENGFDSYCICGADQNNNSFSLRFVVKFDNIAEIFLCLRLNAGIIYTFPESKVRLYRLSSLKWKTNDLYLEVVEPFKILRVIFNGLLANEANGAIEHVHCSFIWNSAGSPRFYPNDASTSLLTKAICKETWKDGHWLDFLGNDEGFEQFGALRGYVKGKAFAEDLLLNLPCSRTRIIDKFGNIENIVHHLIVGKDGAILSIWTKKIINGCKQIIFGNVILNNGEIHAIDDCDIRLRHYEVPNVLTLHVYVKRKVFRAVTQFNLHKSVEFGCSSINAVGECDLNTQQGRSVINIWSKNPDIKLELPPPLSVEKKLARWPSSYIVNFSDQEAKVSQLTGGKGCSLALLCAIDTDQFSVPDGFIVTVNAFNRQIDLNFHVKKSVNILDDICCKRTNGNLEQSCAETVKLIQNTDILAEVKDEILQKLSQNDGPWAVRSSAVGEDSEELSAAGQNETFLGCTTPQDVTEKIAACWASLFTYQSVQYRNLHGLPVISQMAVVVQKMVPADKAGVLFTLHPTSSDPSLIVITSNHGLGESVVSGKSEPDTIILRRGSKDKLTIESLVAGEKKIMVKLNDDRGVEEVQGDKEFSLRDEEAIQLGNVGLFLEKVFGNGRDIEWAFHQGKLYLLQSRPITTTSSWSEDELLNEFNVPILTEENVFTTANVGEVLPGSIPALTISLIVNLIDKVTQEMIYHVIDPYSHRFLPSFQNHLFLDVVGSLHKNVDAKISIASKVLDLAIIGHPVMDETIHRLSISKFGLYSKGKKFQDFLEMLRYAWRNESLLKRAQELNATQMEITATDNLNTILPKIKELLKIGFEIVKMHSSTTRTSVSYQVIAMTILAEDNQDFNVDHYNDVAILLSSCEDVISAQIPTMLAAIADVIRQKDNFEEFVKIEPVDGQEWLKENNSQAYQMFEEFIRDHGHRGVSEMDISKNTWAMSPGDVVKMIQINCRRNDVRQEKRSLSIEEVIKSLKSPKKASTRKVLKYLMKKCRRAVSVREQTKSELVMYCDKLRTAFTILAEKMIRTGLLPDKDLIFHLSFYEIEVILQDFFKNDTRNPNILIKALRRQKHYPKWHKLTFPELNFGTPVPEKREFIRTGNSKVKCEGTPVQTGVIQARACVIISLSNIDELRDGDILITYCTDIGWSPYFPMLSGIVTELGGLVSHGAVIAREYGLPCIVGAKGATELFKTGDIVILSGKDGIIELVEDKS